MQRVTRAACCAAASCIPPPIGKPRGRTCHVGPEHDQRFSFCCAVDGCRSRATPPSLRFLGRKVYLATIVVLASMMQHGVTERRMRQLTEAVGIDRRTVVRWREDFTASRSGRRRPAPH
jgi:hypothetical protein